MSQSRCAVRGFVLFQGFEGRFNGFLVPLFDALDDIIPRCLHVALESCSNVKDLQAVCRTRGNLVLELAGNVFEYFLQVIRPLSKRISSVCTGSGRALTLVVTENLAGCNFVVTHEFLKQVFLVEYKVNRGVGKDRVVHGLLEERQGLLHAVHASVLKEHRVVPENTLVSKKPEGLLPLTPQD